MVEIIYLINEAHILELDFGGKKYVSCDSIDKLVDTSSKFVPLYFVQTSNFINHPDSPVMGGCEEEFILSKISDPFYSNSEANKSSKRSRYSKSSINEFIPEPEDTNIFIRVIQESDLKNLDIYKYKFNYFSIKLFGWDYHYCLDKDNYRSQSLLTIHNIIRSVPFSFN